VSQTLVCGFGSVGKKVCEVLMEARSDFTVIDKAAAALNSTPYPHVVGDAANEDVLRAAGVDGAKTMVVCTESDATNSFIVLIARGINPRLTILAIIRRLESIEKLYKAGADQVVAESVIGAQIIAKHAISEHIGEFIDRITLARNIEITELEISTGSPIAGVMLKNSRIRENSGATVVAMKRGEQLLVNPGANTKLMAGDLLIVMGNGGQIKSLSKMARREAKK